jgi:DNA-binding IscR family transcriptional regulator
MYISKEKKEKISEQILAYLYSANPKPLFTAHIAKEIARDEEFIKKLLIDLKKKEFVIEITKNPKGKEYLRRSRWKLSEKIYVIYKQKQALK